MSAIDKAVEAAKDAVSYSTAGRVLDSFACDDLARAAVGRAIDEGHLVPADDPDALLAALVASGRLEKVDPVLLFEDDPDAYGRVEFFVRRESGS